MFFKQLDFISPRVTFYYKGFLSHSSILSGILSLFAFILVILTAVYFSFELFKKEHPTAFYFKSFEEDAGQFPLNSSSLFHFISLSLNKRQFIDEGVDFQSFRIIGLEEYYPRYVHFNNLTKFDHWLYGYCNKEKDTQNINNLINHNFFAQSACIRKYFDSKEQKYYDTGDPKFRWPLIAHGTYNPDNKFYCIILEKCEESTLHLILNGDYHCRTDNEIKEKIGFSSVAHFYFIDNYIDVLNYKHPITKFIYRIENTIQTNTYPTNHLNFNPSLIKTFNSFIFDDFDNELSFSFERNDVIFYNDNNKTYTVYYLWLNNRKNYYERNYKKIQDVISDIGGIFHFLSFLSIYINRIYNNYIVLSDTETLLKSLIHFEKEKHYKNSIDYTKKKQDLKELKNKNFHKSLSKNLDKEKKKKDSNIGKNITEKDLTKSNDFCMANIKNEINNINQNIDKRLYRKNAIYNKNYNFWYYTLFLISLGKKNNFFKVYEHFRIKILSEEHLFRNHLNICNLLKINERKINSKKRYSYEIKDLMSLV